MGIFGVGLGEKWLVWYIIYEKVIRCSGQVTVKLRLLKLRLPVNHRSSNFTPLFNLRLNYL